jgi:hypothetical protein
MKMYFRIIFLRNVLKTYQRINWKGRKMDGTIPSTPNGGLSLLRCKIKKKQTRLFYFIFGIKYLI